VSSGHDGDLGMSAKTAYGVVALLAVVMLVVVLVRV
jgi:hypothetical protein